MYGVSQKFENYFKLGGHATSLEIMNKMKLFVDFVWKESEGQRETEKKTEQFHLNIISIQMEREGSSNAIELCHIIVVVIQ